MCADTNLANETIMGIKTYIYVCQKRQCKITGVMWKYKHTINYQVLNCVVYGVILAVKVQIWLVHVYILQIPWDHLKYTGYFFKEDDLLTCKNQ